MYCRQGYGVKESCNWRLHLLEIKHSLLSVWIHLFIIPVHSWKLLKCFRKVGVHSHPHFSNAETEALESCCVTLNPGIELQSLIPSPFPYPLDPAASISISLLFWSPRGSQCPWKLSIQILNPYCHITCRVSSILQHTRRYIRAQNSTIIGIL